MDGLLIRSCLRSANARIRQEQNACSLEAKIAFLEGICHKIEPFFSVVARLDSMTVG